MQENPTNEPGDAPEPNENSGNNAESQPTAPQAQRRGRRMRREKPAELFAGKVAEQAPAPAFGEVENVAEVEENLSGAKASENEPTPPEASEKQATSEEPAPEPEEAEAVAEAQEAAEKTTPETTVDAQEPAEPEETPEPPPPSRRPLKDRHTQGKYLFTPPETDEAPAPAPEGEDLAFEYADDSRGRQEIAWEPGDGGGSVAGAAKGGHAEIGGGKLPKISEAEERKALREVRKRLKLEERRAIESGQKLTVLGRIMAFIKGIFQEPDAQPRKKRSNQRPRRSGNNAGRNQRSGGKPPQKQRPQGQGKGKPGGQRKNTPNTPKAKQGNDAGKDGQPQGRSNKPQGQNKGKNPSGNQRKRRSRGGKGNAQKPKPQDKRPDGGNAQRS